MQDTSFHANLEADSQDQTYGRATKFLGRWLFLQTCIWLGVFHFPLYLESFLSLHDTFHMQRVAL